MVEVIVAIALVTIVLLGGSIALNSIQQTTSQQRNVLEASNLATKYEELFQADAYQNSGNVSPGTYTYTDTVGSTIFTTKVEFNLEDPSGTSTAPQTLCVSSTQSETGIIWGIVSTVSWNHMAGSGPVVQTTDIAPGKAGVQSLSNATIAAAIEGTDGTPLANRALKFQISENQLGSSTTPPPLPNNGQVDYTTSSGCAVVTSLVADPNWAYTVTIAGNPGWVSSQELSDLTPNQPSSGQMTVSSGEVTKLTNPIQMGLGQTETVSLQPVKFSCGQQVTPSCFATGFSPATNVPITVGNPSLSGGSYTFGIGGPTPTSMLLYPYSNGYSVWTGDSTQSSPGWVNYAATEQQQPTAISVTAGATGSVAVPVYRLGVQTSAGGTITATEQSGLGVSFTLPAQGGSYLAGVPLGQYELESNGTPLSPNPYVWLTPSGWIAGTSATAAPTGTPSTGDVVES